MGGQTGRIFRRNPIYIKDLEGYAQIGWGTCRPIRVYRVFLILT
jgi:hypothetical protein